MAGTASGLPEARKLRNDVNINIKHSITYHGALLLHDLLLHGFVHHAADLLLLAGLDGHVLAGHLGNLVTGLLVVKWE